MSERLPTIGGQVTRGEVYSKLLHHLRESQELCAVMGHLHQTESSEMDKVLAKGWLGMSELMGRTAHQVTQLAMNKLN